MDTVRDAMLNALAQQPRTIKCNNCSKPWSRPAGMIETRCPECSARRGAGDLPAGERLARDVTRYRLAIEEATDALRLGQPKKALQFLLSVEAPGRAVRGQAIIGPPVQAQGRPDAAPTAPTSPSGVPHMGLPGSPCVLCGVMLDNANRGRMCPEPAPVEAVAAEAAEQDDDPIALVRDLALGAYKVQPKRGRPRGRRSRT